MDKLREFAKKADIFLHTDYYLGIVAFIVFFSWVLHIELVGMCLLAVCVILTLFCCDDALPAFAPVITFSFTMSGFFNPDTYPKAIIVIFICLVILITGGFVWFFIKNKVKIKLGRFFWFFCAMLIVFLLSGIANPETDFSRSIPLTVALGGGAFLAYFFFVNSVTKSDSIYFAKMFLCVGIIIMLELFVCYMGYRAEAAEYMDVKGQINLGWGISNNIGSILLLTVAMTFYLAVKDDKYVILYTILAYLQYISVFFSMSRGSILCAIAVLPFIFAFTVKVSKKRKAFLLSTIIPIVIFMILLIVFHKEVVQVAERITELGTYSSGRDIRFKLAIDDFLAFPIFGRGVFFTPETGAMYWYHNTFLQFLGSAGIIGALTYLAYSYMKFKVLIVKGDLINKFILFGLIMWTGYSMLDCGSFLISQVMLVVVLLAYAEKNVWDKNKQAVTACADAVAESKSDGSEIISNTVKDKSSKQADDNTEIN